MSARAQGNPQRCGDQKLIGFCNVVCKELIAEMTGPRRQIDAASMSHLTCSGGDCHLRSAEAVQGNGFEEQPCVMGKSRHGASSASLVRN